MACTLAKRAFGSFASAVSATASTSAGISGRRKPVQMLSGNLQK